MHDTRGFEGTLSAQPFSSHHLGCAVFSFILTAKATLCFFSLPTAVDCLAQAQVYRTENQCFNVH